MSRPKTISITLSKEDLKIIDDGLNVIHEFRRGEKPDEQEMYRLIGFLDYIQSQWNSK